LNSLTPNSNIIFECSDDRNDTGLLVTKDNINNKDFQLHLYDGYNDIALVINMDIQDFANMFDSLSEYFQQREDIEL
jgi:hypothetical protein